MFNELLSNDRCSVRTVIFLEFQTEKQSMYCCQISKTKNSTCCLGSSSLVMIRSYVIIFGLPGQKTLEINDWFKLIF